MTKEKPTTKICKHCKTEIPYDAKVCPNCRRKVKGGGLKWILITFIALMIIGSIFGGGDKNNSKKIGEVSQKNESKTENVENAKNEIENPKAEDAEVEDATAENTAEADIQTVYHVGDILKDGDMEIVYMASGDHVENNEFLQPAEGKKYIYIQLAFKNTSSKSDAAVSMYNFEGYADGYNVEMYYGGEEKLSSTLSAGRSTSGYLYFEVPNNAQNIEIEYTPNFLTNKKLTFVYEGEKNSGYTVEANTSSTEGAVNVGESTESRELKITYLQCFRDSSDNMFIEAKEGYHYVTCEFEFENLSKSDQSVTAFSFDCFADGVACEDAFFRDDNLSGTLSAGRKVKGTVTFEVPDNAATVEVEYLSNFWTSKRVVFSANA